MFIDFKWSLVFNIFALRPGSTVNCIYGFVPPPNPGQNPGQKLVKNLAKTLVKILWFIWPSRRVFFRLFELVYKMIVIDFECAFNGVWFFP